MCPFAGLEQKYWNICHCFLLKRLGPTVSDFSLPALDFFMKICYWVAWYDSGSTILICAETGVLNMKLVYGRALLATVLIHHKLEKRRLRGDRLAVFKSTKGCLHGRKGELKTKSWKRCACTVSSFKLLVRQPEQGEILFPPYSKKSHCSCNGVIQICITSGGGVNLSSAGVATAAQKQGSDLV